MMTTADARDVAAKLYGMAGTATRLDSEWGGTFAFQADSGSKYTLKVSPDMVSTGRTGMEIAAIDYLSMNSTNLALPELIRTTDGRLSGETPFGTCRMYSWVEGRLWHTVNPKSPVLLNSLGRALANLHYTLTGFEHPSSREDFLWSIDKLDEIEAMVFDIPAAQKALLQIAVDTFNSTRADIDALPKCINYNDANDHNIVVSERIENPGVKGFIDFGDLSYGPSTQDLAVCLTYAMMGFADPVGAACDVISGYNEVIELSDREIHSLFPLVCARLALSLSHSILRSHENPDNDYWQVSARSAWALLEKLANQNMRFIEYRWRDACGLEPCPSSRALRDWLKINFNTIYPIMGFDLSKKPVEILDWSVGSTELGGLDNISDVEKSTFNTFSRIAKAGAIAGIGRYNEPRVVYTSAGFQSEGNNGPEMRTIHIGLDIFSPAGTPLYAPLDGIVHTIVNNNRPKEYGPLLILEHVIEDSGLHFYTLYGHNSLGSLDYWKKGDHVNKGDKIAEIGNYPENGNWIPHVHFQIITDLLNFHNDYPGVALPGQRRVWLSICPDPNLFLGIDAPELKVDSPSPDEVLKRRQKVLGNNLSVSYKQPLHIVRGWKSQMYTSDGTAYLDTVNNISHVGHEHPRIVAAAAKQGAVLNTNTRYLHETVLELGERLLSTLPDHLSRMYFVNSGSEANDLALRIARNYTGRNKTLVMHEAYHGITRSCLEVSPHKFLGTGGNGPHEDVTVLPSTLFVDEAECISEALRIVADIGDTPVFIHETLPSCAGQVVPPSGYFRALYDHIHTSNGVCIADEVQTGLGRMGNAYWSFELYDIAPDIVTMGKPLGNGHPIGAVAISEHLADQFDNGMEFFSSFGGNPVSSAIALEVLNVVRDEDLQSRANADGTHWIEQLREIQNSFPIIRDVRGLGFFIGIEFADPRTLNPATLKAKYIQQRLLENKILTSLDGPHTNVMKIKPPMCISKESIDYFNNKLLMVLQEDIVSG